MERAFFFFSEANKKINSSIYFTIKCLHSFSFAHTQTNNIRPIFVKDECATVKNWDTKWLVIFIDVEPEISVMFFVQNDYYL